MDTFFGRCVRLRKWRHKLLPVSVIITTLNEAKNLGRCLNSLHDFDEIIVVDSNSTDGTQDIAHEFGVHLETYRWNGAYPKKRQWCLDNLEIKNDFVFWIDGDEVIEAELIEELMDLDLSAAGYFVKGQYIWNDAILSHGVNNNKLALFNRHKVEFPVVDDLDILGMGEIEGHYQPVLKPEYAHEKLKQLKEPLLHYAYEDTEGWEARHKRYAGWEAAMIQRGAYPKDPVAWREGSKTAFRKMPMRGAIAFVHCYIMKFGFLDGRLGFEFAKSRYDYYELVKNALKASKGQA